MSRMSDRLICYAVIAAAVVLYVLTLVLAGWRLAIPSDGARFGLQTSNSAPDTVTITWTLSQQEDLQNADRVIAVAGQSVTAWAKAALRRDATQPDWTFSQLVTYTIIRDGEILDVPVILGKHPIEQILLKNIPTVMLLIGVQIAAGWILACRPYERGAQTLFLAAAALVTFSLCWFLYMDISTHG